MVLMFNVIEYFHACRISSSSRRVVALLFDVLSIKKSLTCYQYFFASLYDGYTIGCLPLIIISGVYSFEF